MEYISCTSFGDNTTVLERLEDLEYEKFRATGIPVVIFLTILSAVGTLGNIHTLIIYGFSPEMKKIAVRVFILWLSAVDLSACVFCIPFEIFDIRYDYTFSSTASCKLFRYIGQAGSFTSAGFLATIAVERNYITRRSSTRYTEKSSAWFHKISFIVFVVFFALSTPALVVYGVNKKAIPNHTNLTACDCAALEEFKTIPVFVAYGAVVILASSIGFIAMFIIYMKILFIILSQKRKEKERRKNTLLLESSSTALESGDSQIKSEVNSESADEATNTKEDGGIYDRGRRLTITLMVATGVSYVGYLVFISTVIVQVTNPTLYKTIDGSTTALLLRSIFINNAANPVVFSFMDARFRSECISIYQRCIKRIQDEH